MLRFLYDWLVLAPADLFADLLTCMLVLFPVAAGCGVGALVYALMEKRGRSDGSQRRQYFALATASIAGLYVALIIGVGITRLPISIFRFLISS
jgi:hypothetical protein